MEAHDAEATLNTKEIISELCCGDQASPKEGAKRLQGMGEVMYAFEKEECISYEMPFMDIPTPIIWHSVDMKKLSPSFTQQGALLRMNIESPYSSQWLRRVIFHLRFPEVKIINEYTDCMRIGWSATTHHSIVKEAILKAGGDILDRLDYGSMEAAATVMPKGTTLAGRGYPPSSTYLASFQTHSVQPWHYSLPQNNGFPLFALGDNQVLTHEYTLDLDPVNHLDLTHICQDTGASIPLDASKHREMFTVLPGVGITVEAYGEYVAILPLEERNTMAALLRGKAIAKVVHLSTSHLKDNYSYNRASNDEDEWEVVLGEEKILSLMWTVRDVDNPNRLLTLPHALVNDSEEAASNCGVKRSRLTIEVEEEVMTKFDLPGHITGLFIPSLVNHSASPCDACQHLYAFTRFDSVACTVTDFKAINGKLIVSLFSSNAHVEAIDSKESDGNHTVAISREITGSSEVEPSCDGPEGKRIKMDKVVGEGNRLFVESHALTVKTFLVVDSADRRKFIIY